MTALRPAIRDAMRAAPGRRFTLPSLAAALRHQFPDTKDREVKDALLWNLGKGFVDFIHDAEMEHDLYFLTERGRDA